MTDVEMAKIPAGRVLRGDLRGAERREIVVEAFEIGVYPVTEEQLAELLGIPSLHPRRPAVDVSWLRAIRLCNALSEWEGLDPVYSFDGEVVDGDAEADGFRLPTDDEWEYACRAGSVSAAYGPVRDVAWTAADGVGHPSEVGARLPNLPARDCHHRVRLSPCAGCPNVGTKTSLRRESRVRLRGDRLYAARFVTHRLKTDDRRWSGSHTSPPPARVEPVRVPGLGRVRRTRLEHRRARVTRPGIRAMRVTLGLHRSEEPGA